MANPPSTPPKGGLPGTSGLSFYSYQNPTNAAAVGQNFVGASPSTNSSSIYRKEANYAYMGTKRDAKTGKLTDEFMQVSGADISYYFLSKDAQQQLKDQMDAVYGKGDWNLSWINKFYSRGLQASAYAYANMGTKVTAIDAAKYLINQAGEMGVTPDGSAAGGGGGGGPTTTIATTQSVSLTDPLSAKKVLNTALEQYLGRRATETEQANFLKTLNRAEERSPSVTTQMSTTAPGKGVSRVQSQVRSEGGFNPSVFAEEYARGQEGAAEYQAATTYLDSFINSLGARV